MLIRDHESWMARNYEWTRKILTALLARVADDDDENDDLFPISKENENNIQWQWEQWYHTTWPSASTSGTWGPWHRSWTTRRDQEREGYPHTSAVSARASDLSTIMSSFSPLSRILSTEWEIRSGRYRCYRSWRPWRCRASAGLWWWHRRWDRSICPNRIESVIKSVPWSCGGWRRSQTWSRPGWSWRDR